MFSKIKSKKLPAALNSVDKTFKVNDKNGAFENINSKTLSLQLFRRLGVAEDSIFAVAYDPVQSLLAVSTREKQIRVFGKEDVEVTFELSISKPINNLMFIKGVYLVGATTPGDSIVVISLYSRKILGSYSTPGNLISVASHYSLDFVALGLSSGTTMFYDVDRLSISPLRIDNQQKNIMPKTKMSGTLYIEWHPRDIGSLLITYSHCAVWYSVTSGKIKSVFALQLAKGLRGFDQLLALQTNGKRSMFSSQPKELMSTMKEAHFHPNGIHVVTVHNDASFSFWDGNNGTLIQTRNLNQIDLHKEGAPYVATEFVPIHSFRWLCSSDPELTQIIIAGGTANSAKILTVLDLGTTLKYSLTSNEKQSQFYSNPSGGIKQISFKLSSPNHEDEFINTIVPFPSSLMPFFSGNQNPQYMAVLTNKGNLFVSEYAFQSVSSVAKPVQGLPHTLALASPMSQYTSLVSVPRMDWYSCVSSDKTTQFSKNTLNGGASSHITNDVKISHKFEAYRTIQVSIHAGAIFKLREVFRGDVSSTNEENLVDLSDVLYTGHHESGPEISYISTGFESRQIIVGTNTGEAVICIHGKYSTNNSFDEMVDFSYEKCPIQHQNDDAVIYYVKKLNKVHFKSSSFVPSYILKCDDTTISCIKTSNIGFGAVAYDSGRLIVCDISRGPAVILNSKSINEYLVTETGRCCITCMEFTIMEYGEEGFSSILLVCGTNSGGHVLVFKIIPQSNGGFTVILANKILSLNYRRLGGDDSSSSKIHQLIPINIVSGESAIADMTAFRNLSKGIKIKGAVVITSDKDIRILALPKTKIARKSADDKYISTGILNIKEGYAIVTVLRSGHVCLYSIPNLNEIAKLKVPPEVCKIIQSVSYEKNIIDILLTGDLFLKTSPTQLEYFRFRTKDANSDENQSIDALFNENAYIPPPPTSSTFEWAKGNFTSITIEELNTLIAGPNRRPAKNRESEMAQNLCDAGIARQSYGTPSHYPEKLYEDPVRRSAQQSSRFGDGGFMRSLQSGIDSVEESFNNAANNISESITETTQSSKNSFYSAALKSKFGF